MEGTRKNHKRNVDVTGDYDRALDQWISIQKDYGETKISKGAPGGFSAILPDGTEIRGDFFGGGNTNSTGYTIKITKKAPEGMPKQDNLYLRFRKD